MTGDDVFKHSTPELYDRYMVPLLFERSTQLHAASTLARRAEG
jgi:cob(I)alamin adenosyltransferase